jgi:hypothetical protein
MQARPVEIWASLVGNPLKVSGVHLGRARGLGRADVSLLVGDPTEHSDRRFVANTIAPRRRSYSTFRVGFTGLPTQVELGQIDLPFSLAYP